MEGDERMKLLFKQRLLSWFGRYDIYGENGGVIFSVEGKPSWGKRLEIYDAQGNYLGQIKRKLWTWLPRYELYIGESMIGEIKKEFTFLKPVFSLSFNNWTVTGNFMEWDYQVLDARGQLVMNASKELWNWTDTYIIDVFDAKDALLSLMIVLVIDAEKESRDN